MKHPKVSSAQVEAVTRLPPAGRYARFIKQLADWKTAWGLVDERGWALLGDPEQEKYVALWPAREYAVACQGEAWSDATPTELSLDDLLAKLIPSLREVHRRIAVFPAPDGTFVAPELDTVESELRKELDEWYS